jgi:YHS domain-containing protein
MIVTRRLAILAATVALIGLANGFPRVSNAQSPVNTLAGNRLAIHGYDPVAYFVDRGPREGRSDLTVDHAGAVWRFASEHNRKLFETDPERYVPAFGGYCAYGVAQGYLVEIDPAAWSMIDGRLYLNYDLSVRAAWLTDVEGYIRRATANWPRLTSHH